MKKVLLFLQLNLKVLIGVAVGLALGYLHWYNYACYWGTYPMSSECWVNCLLGAAFGGFIMSLFDRKSCI